MRRDVRSPICTPTLGIASYYEMRCQKSDPHHNRRDCKLLCNATSEIRSASQHRVLQVTMRRDVRSPICTPTLGIASYYETRRKKSDLHSDTGYCKLL